MNPPKDVSGMCGAEVWAVVQKIIQDKREFYKQAKSSFDVPAAQQVFEIAMDTLDQLSKELGEEIK
jgi:hypothetical protein